MSTWMESLRIITLCAGVLLLGAYATASLAGVEEDYATALQSYNRGDVAAAIKTLRKGADGGHAPSQVLLGHILDQSDDDEEAVAYYRRAAEQNHADGEFGLGRMYAAGEGVKRNPAEARKWITRAAERGHSQATAVLSQAYMRGELGILDAERQSEAAYAWIRRAADLGHLQSLEYLAAGYRKGVNGLPVDVKQAELYEARVKQVRGAGQKPPGKRKS